MKLPSISVAIPTYGRDQVLIDTIAALLSLAFPPDEIIIVDQSKTHDDTTNNKLSQWAENKNIIWLKRNQPSIPKAMNHALKTASNDIVLFLDDDISIPSPLISAHAEAYLDANINYVVGQVIQPWQKILSDDADCFEKGNTKDPDAFQFNSNRRCWVERVMAGNLSVRRKMACKIGGFDENFVQVAFRFEAEFADRILASGQQILFQPTASIHHLRVSRGGTRSYGEHLTTIKPSHSVGKYYYYMQATTVKKRYLKLLYSPFRAIATRFHLTHPWWIPVTVIAEIWGALWAFYLYIKGPAYLKVTTDV